MKKTWLALALLAAAPGFAGDKGKDKQDFKDRPFPPPRMVEDLKLTDAQSKDLKKLHDKHVKEIEAQRDKVQAQREAMKAALEKDTSDKDLWAIQEKLAAARAGMEKIRFGHILEVRKVLTPEQRVKFQHKMEFDRERFKRRGGKFQGKRDGKDERGPRGDAPPPPPPEDDDEDGPADKPAGR